MLWASKRNWARKMAIHKRGWKQGDYLTTQRHFDNIGQVIGSEHNDDPKPPFSLHPSGRCAGRL